MRRATSSLALSSGGGASRLFLCSMGMLIARGRPGGTDGCGAGQRSAVHAVVVARGAVVHGAEVAREGALPELVAPAELVGAGLAGGDERQGAGAAPRRPGRAAGLLAGTARVGVPVAKGVALAA